MIAWHISHVLTMIYWVVFLSENTMLSLVFSLQGWTSIAQRKASVNSGQTGMVVRLPALPIHCLIIHSLSDLVQANVSYYKDTYPSPLHKWIWIIQHFNKSCGLVYIIWITLDFMRYVRMSPHRLGWNLLISVSQSQLIQKIWHS